MYDVMDAPLAPGTLLHDRYHLVGVAAKGPFGQTYLVRDRKRQNQLCVVKEFIPIEKNPAVLQGLWQQFQMAAADFYALQEAQLPRFQVMILHRQRFYWVREYIEGKSYGVLLAERKSIGQTFSEAEVQHLLEQVLPVLGYLHRRGVIHRNLSLENLILRQRDQLPVLINFGWVKEQVVRLQLQAVKPHRAIATWGYAPPEQFYAGKVSAQSDLYALAVVAIVLLTGKAPEELYDQAAQVFDWETWALVHPKFGRILRRMLNPHPQKRFASATQVLQALQEAYSSSALVPEHRIVNRPIAAPRPLRPKRSVKLPLQGSFILAIGLAFITAMLTWTVVSSLLVAPRSTDQPQTATPTPSATLPPPSPPEATPLPPPAVPQPIPVPTPPPPP